MVIRMFIEESMEWTGRTTHKIRYEMFFFLLQKQSNLKFAQVPVFVLPKNTNLIFNINICSIKNIFI